MNTEHKANNKAEKNLIIALGTTLHLNIDGVADGLTGVLVGMVPNEYLIIQGQFYDIEDKLCKESKAIVRYVHEAIVYKFSSQLLGVISTPVELGFLAYPEEIETIELRSNKRIECFLPAELVIRGEKYQVVIRDISEGGCRLKAKLPKGKALPAITSNDQLTLIAQLSGKEYPQLILGEVRHIQFLSDFDAEEMHIGAKFHERGLEDLKTIIEHNSFV
jgi:hypothetical protein